jgi:hypothetical protein
MGISDIASFANDAIAVGKRKKSEKKENEIEVLPYVIDTPFFSPFTKKGE